MRRRTGTRKKQRKEISWTGYHCKTTCHFEEGLSKVEQGNLRYVEHGAKRRLRCGRSIGEGEGDEVDPETLFVHGVCKQYSYFV